MPLDAAFLYRLTDELGAIKNAHIEKIHQPTNDELVLVLRAPHFSKRLLISAHPGCARVHFTESRPENPPTPPMFCMLMRKFFGASRIADIVMIGLERVIKITVSSLNEMGDVINPSIYIELIGAAPNIIAVDNNGKIIDALRRSNMEKSGRMLQPGAKYTLPTDQNRINILESNIDTVCSSILKCENLSVEKAVMSNLSGFSPLVCREIAFALSGNTDTYIRDLNSAQQRALKQILSNKKEQILNMGKPYILLNPNGEPFDFCYCNIFQYGKGYINEECESFSDLLDRFYTKKAYISRLKRESTDLLKLLSNLENRIIRRMSERKKDLKKCENREQLRIFGELLKANLYRIKSGQKFAELENYYDENLSLVKIPLNPALSPANNATKYFKDYKKTYIAEQTLTRLIEDDEKELEYIYSVLDSLTRAQDISDINDIRAELADAGYIKRQQKVKKVQPQFTFTKLISPGGHTVLVGRNNLQNDMLTLHKADKNDLWFHTKNIPGSHVILACPQNEASDDDIIFAATVAASNSKAKTSSNVAVDYTPVKFVKKPSGAKPGMVIYSTNKTVYVNPI